MENTAILDGITGIIAIAILIGGLIMLFQGISSMQKK